MNEYPNAQNLSGLKLGKLLVLKQDFSGSKKEKGTHWMCKCECGKIISVSRNNLKPYSSQSRATRSCGCVKINKMDRVKVLWKKAFCNKIYNQIQKKKNLIHSLTEKEFQTIASQSCHYCGKPFSCVYKDTRWKNGKEIKMTESEIRLNGIDRIDSSIGYTKDNCVPCCINCNQAKNTLSQEEFSKHIIRIYNYFCK